MHLAVSNIAWENDELNQCLALLRDLHCDVELAASCVWPEPADTSPSERQTFKNEVASFGLTVVGLHSLLYTRPDLALFDGTARRKALVDYLKRSSDLCADLGGKTMIFGSPRSRALNGMSYEAALDIAADAFRQVAQHAAERGVFLCIEPLGRDETDFITCSAEGMDLVKRVGHGNFQLHLDAKAMMAAGEDYESAISTTVHCLKHFHVGDPGLAPPGTTGVDHRPIGNALRSSGYGGYVSIEMRRGFGNSDEVIRRSVAYVQRCYLVGA